MPLIVERRDRVVVLTLSDPERRNALTLPLVDQIVSAFDRLEQDDDIGAVVVTGDGEAFCSGADVSALAAMASEHANDDDRHRVTAVYRGFLRVLESTLPTVAAINGPAVGAGFNLALACDVRLVGESARLDARFVRIGLHPGGGHLWLLERAVGPQAAAAITLFGNALSGDDAVRRGLAWSCHADVDLLDAAVAFAQRAAEVPKPLMTRAKQTLRASPWQPDFDSAVATELGHQAWSFTQGWFGRR
jgi:enoyl-CoA hydratase